MNLDCSYRGLPDVSLEVKEGSHVHTHTNTYMVFLKPPPSPSKKSRKGKEWVLRYGLLGLN